VSARIAALAVALAACGGGGGGDDDDDACAATGRYLELAPGRAWSYRITDNDGVRSTKTQTVGDLEDVGGAHAGTTAYRLTTVKGEQSMGMTISWQQDTGDGVIRLREQDDSGSTQTDETYMPFRHRLDESVAHVAVGATWDETYDEIVTIVGGDTTTTTKTEHWEVFADDELVTVPAGVYCTLHLHRTSMVGDTDGSDKHYWFTRGVGKVKELGAGQAEELTGTSP
jgi:hypothetical protein